MSGNNQPHTVWPADEIQGHQWIWHGDSLGDPHALASIWISKTKQVLLADVLKANALHCFDKDGQQHILNQICLCWDKALLHPADLAAIEGYCRRNLPPLLWQPGLWDKGVQ